MHLLIRKRGDLDWRVPKVMAYENELHLQELIAASPDLLPGEQQLPLVAAREVAVPDTGAVDVVTVDAGGRVTVVECKLATNSEMRRTVVGQLVAYAAGLSKLPYEDFDRLFSARSDQPLALMMDRAAEAAGVEWDEEEFRRRVEANLEAGSFRLVLAVDQVTDELKRVVEYLNTHSEPSTEFLALELGFIADEGVEIIVPRVYGEETVRAKGQPRRRWDEDSFFQALQSVAPEGTKVIQDLYETARSIFDRSGGEFRWGSGPNPSVTAAFRLGERTVATWTAVVWTGGQQPIWAPQFMYLREAVADPPLSIFADRLSAISGFRGLDGLKAADFRRKPEISVDALAAPGAAEAVKQALAELLASQPLETVRSPDP